MSFEKTVRGYLKAMHDYIERAAVTGDMTPELSYRPVLNTFLHDVSRLYCQDVDIIFEPKAQGRAGRPDWRLYNTKNLGSYGFVEAKGLDLRNPINLESHKEQITKYLGTGQRVILTDGLEFIFFEPTEIGPPHRHCLIEKPICLQSPMKSRVDILLDNRLRDFFRDTSSRQCSEEQLIKEMAVRASALADCVLILSEAPCNSGVSEDENKTINILHELRSALQLHHDPVLKHPKVFADFVAQVLCFGLLYAHRVVAGDTNEPSERYNAIRCFWSDAVYASYADRLIPFKALVAILESELSPNSNSDSQIRCWYDDTRRLLAHIELRDTQRKAPDYHTLYENFLKEYDPKTRFDFGAFYTPRELASFTVCAAKAIIESLFPGRSLFEKGNKIIDPCCGTGTFLEQLVKHSKKGNAAHLIGFEILPAPYALAHYRRVMIELENGSEQTVDIFLTNTLSNEFADDQVDQPNDILQEELCRARNCAKPPIVLVIGNPPSSDSFGPHSTGINFTMIEKLLEDFRPDSSRRHIRQNIQKQIKNDFMKFLRWAADKVLSSEIGVLALILPSSFAAHPTYKYARGWLTNNFGEFWVLDIDRDLRTGASSSSLFETLQGRMLLIASHSGAVPINRVGRLNYAAITDSGLPQKKIFLDKARTTAEYISLFTKHDLDEQTSAFRPNELTRYENHYDKKMYSHFWSIHSANQNGPQAEERCVFIRHCSGTKLAPTSLFVHPTEAMLKRRSSEIGNLDKSYADLKSLWFSGQRKPPTENKLTAEVRLQLKEASKKNTAYRRYAFRPFVPMYLLFNEALFGRLAELGGGGTRLRPEIVSAYSSPDTVGIAIAPSPIDLGKDLHRFATFCWDMPDNDLCARGNAHVFCNQFPENKPTGRAEWDKTPKNNISHSLIAAVKAIRPNTTPTEMVFYTYAMLCSGTLLEAFAGAYFTASDNENIPKIPIVKDVHVMDQLISKGQALAYLEKPLMESVKLQNWVAKLQPAFMKPFKLMKYVVDDKKYEIILYSDNRKIEIELKEIPEEILKMTISGYEVVACWLKFHSYSYTRTIFSEANFASLLQLLSCLDLQSALVVEIDAIVERIIIGDVELL